MACELHIEHRPTNRTVENHHVIPRAWQGFWCPPGAVLHAGGLFDPRTVAICPTGHRNVHFYIVELMKYLAAHRMESVVDAMAEVKPHGHRGEFDTASEALQRWEAAGGKLLDLADAGEWGEA